MRAQSRSKRATLSLSLSLSQRSRLQDLRLLPPVKDSAPLNSYQLAFSSDLHGKKLAMMHIQTQGVFDPTFQARVRSYNIQCEIPQHHTIVSSFAFAQRIVFYIHLQIYYFAIHVKCYVFACRWVRRSDRCRRSSRCVCRGFGCSIRSSIFIIFLT